MHKVVFLAVALFTLVAARHDVMKFHSQGEEEIGTYVAGRLVEKKDRPIVDLTLTSLEPGLRAWRADYKICFESMQHLWTGKIQLYFPGRTEQVLVPLCDANDPAPRCWEQFQCLDGDRMCLNKSFPCITVHNRRFEWSSLRRDIGSAEFPTARVINRDEKIVIDLKPTVPDV